jgi:hypothetical protein
MDSGVLGLGAVAWTDAWNAAAPEAGLRLSVDPARLLELLKDVPASRALLSDLQRAVPAGRAVELLVTPDRQVAEVATGTSHYVLTVAARNTVLQALVGPVHGETVRPGGRTTPPGAGEPTLHEAGRPAGAAAGVLWRSPGTEAHVPTPLFAVPLEAFGTRAQLEVARDGAGQGTPGQADEARVFQATLRLSLPRLGAISARIRVCGATVAVSIECDEPESLRPQLSELGRRLIEQGLAPAFLGAETARRVG